MIRRGLQIFLGMLLLGAAPSFGQTLPSWWVWPAQVVVTGLPITNGSDPNGLYVNTGVLSATGYIYGQYSVGQGHGWQMDLRYYSATRVFWTIRQGGSLWYNADNMPESSFASLPYTQSPIRRWDGVAMSGSSAIFQGPPPPVDPYEEAFPDWESAAVKIPLGFSFAMAFWAAAVGLAVTMKWVRDLASAAT